MGLASLKIRQDVSVAGAGAESVSRKGSWSGLWGWLLSPCGAA